MDKARELLLEAVEPVASVWGELNRDLTIEQVEIGLGLGFEATGERFIAQGADAANVNCKLTVRPKQQGLSGWPWSNARRFCRSRSQRIERANTRCWCRSRAR